MTNKEIDTVCEKMGVQIHHNKFWYDGLIIGIITPDDFGNCKVSVMYEEEIDDAKLMEIHLAKAIQTVKDFLLRRKLKHMGEDFE